MKNLISTLFIALTVLTSVSYASDLKDPETLIMQARESINRNYFNKALKLLEEARTVCKTKGNMDKYSSISSEIWQLQKINYDYRLKESELTECAGKNKLPITASDIKKLIDAGALEYMVIDGEKRYFSEALINVFFRNPEYAARMRFVDKKNKDLLDKYRWIIFKKFFDPDRKTYTPYTDPQGFLVEAKVKIKKEYFPSKGILKLWVPYPVTKTSQTDVRLISVSHPEWLKSLPDPDAGIGCVYFEIPLPLKEKETKLEIKYSFRQYTVRFNVKPEKVGEYIKNSYIYEHYTKSDDNCKVTPEIKTLAEKISGSEKNPYIAARKLYDYVVDNIKYSFMPHATLSVLKKPESVYVYENKFGDCGAQSIFFAALCRSIGIPARCTGGMQIAPEMNSDHFWAEVYIPCYGWLPVDTSICQAVADVRGLSNDEKKTIKDFFFGSMDPYRFYIQTETDMALYPPKVLPMMMGMAFQNPEAVCCGSSANPEFYLDYEIEFERIR